MRRMFVGFAIACGFAGMLIGVTSARALVVAVRPPVAQQLATADAVVVGRVIGLEPIDIQASPAKNQAKVNYRIAVVQVSEVLHGLKKDTKMVRVGFIAPPMNGNPNGAVQPGGVQIQIQPAIQPFPGRVPFRSGGISLQVGQDGLFLLAKHDSEPFYTAPGYNSFVSSQNNANFANEVKTTKEFCKILENTDAALKSGDRQQKFMAAAVLIGKYRSNPTGQPTKQVPISAAESKLILQALAQGDWQVNRVNTNVPTAQDLFYQLGVGPNDGYRPVNLRTQQDIAAAMQKWLGENSDKYIVKKLVVDPNAKVQPVPINPIPKIRPLPIKKIQGKIQIQPLPAPVPAPLPVRPIQVDPAEPLPVQPAPQPLPIRRD